MTAKPFPPGELFENVCRSGLSTIRPLSFKAGDVDGWNYGTCHLPSHAAYGRLRALLALNMARELNPKRVLEVAAGDGALSACLQLSGSRVAANDLRPEPLRAAIANYHNGKFVEVLPGNVFDLEPKTIGKFDLVTACEIIEHVADAVAFAQHLRRLLTPEGRILLTTPNGAYFRSRLPTYSQVKDVEALKAIQFKPDADGHLYLITPEEMTRIADRAGLEVERLVLWGTPFVSGEARFRRLARWPLPFYRLECACQRLSFGVRRKICNSMSIILRAKA